MATNTADSNAEVSNDGPESDPYEPFRYVTTTAAAGLVYHVEQADQWIESDTVLDLDDWR